MQTILDLQRLDVPVDYSPVGVISCTSSGSNCCNQKQV